MKNYFIDQKTGESSFYICAPLVGSTLGEIAGEMGFVKTYRPDMLEWRLDKINDRYNIPTFLKEIRKMESTLPLIATWRTHKEGGKELTFLQYQTIITDMICSGQVEFVDIEFGFGGKLFANLAEILKNYKVGSIASYHNFKETPGEKEIFKRYVTMMGAGADVCKIAVMPQNFRDVLNLINATYNFRESYPLQPCIGISMGKLGAMTRVTGNLFGSNIGFASLLKTSASGQFTVEETKEMINKFI